MKARASFRSKAAGAIGALLLAACAGSPEREADRAGHPRQELPVTDTGRIDTSTLRGRIVFSAGADQESEEIYVVDADGSNLRQLTNNGAWDFDPAWSPDGMRIVFRRQLNDNDEIFIMNADGSDQRNLTRDPAHDWGPEWSPDGSTIVFNSSRNSPVELFGYVTDPQGTPARLVTDVFFEYPAWSPDGTKIAFMHQTYEGTGGNYDISVMNADGTRVRDLATFPEDEAWPAWSPDGTRIVFASIRDDCAYSDREDCKRTGDVGEYHTLYVMNADGTDEVRVTEVFGQFATWSPGGEYILFTPAPHGFYIMRPDGSDLTELPIDGVGSITLFDWTPTEG